MKKTALTLTLVFALLISAFLMSSVQAENWSTPIPIAKPWLYSSLALSMSADGGKIAFSAWVDNETEIFVINTNSTEPKQLTNNSRMDGFPSISADGSKIAFTSYTLFKFGSGEPLPVDIQLFVVNSDGTGLKKISLPVELSLYSFSISGDGGKIAFSAQQNSANSEYHIFVINSDGTGLTRLTSGINGKNPSISDDGHKIAFYSDIADEQTYDYELFVINSDGTGLKQLTFNATINTYHNYPSITSDGTKIAFAGNVDNTPNIFVGKTPNIFVVNSDGTNLTQLTHDTNDYHPAISGDGSKIVFERYDLGEEGDERSDLTFFVINTDGTELTSFGTWSITSVAGGSAINRDGSTVAFPFYRKGILVSLNLDEHNDVAVPVSVDDYNGQWQRAGFNINITASDDLMVAETYYRINGGKVQNVTVAGQPFVNTEGANNTLEYWSVDIAGKEEQHRVLTGIKLDKTRPTGSITINNKDSYTFSTSVMLSIFTDDISGVAEMRFSRNGTDWTSWEPYYETKGWSLSEEEGVKTVYVQFKDDAGWVSNVYSDTIELIVFPTTLAAAAIVLIAVIGVGLLFYFKKRKH